MQDPAGRGEERVRSPQQDAANAAIEQQPRRAPGRTTLVDQAARSAPNGGAPGRTTLVAQASQGAGRQAEVTPDAAFEAAVADVRRHTQELEAALASGDLRRAREPAHALERALQVASEHAANAPGPAAAQRMGVIIELSRVAEPLLARARGDATGDVHAAAARGVQGQGSQLPHLDAIQRSFGRHDVGGVQAHVGGPATSATRAIGAEAYATGDRVAFGRSPDLHTAAHEAAHVVQQRRGGASGVQLKALDGGSGDVHERHADAVADAVVAGRSAEGLLDRAPGGGTPAVQRKSDPPKPGDTSAPGADGGAQDRGGRPPKGGSKPPQDQPATGEKSAKPGAGGPRSAGGGGGGGGGAAFSGGGIDGKPLKAQIAQFNQGVTQNQSTIQNPAGQNAKPKKDSQEDHDKKVKQYEDGIDGIASMIGDLDAFDELCSGFSDWGEDKDKQQKGIAGVRASKPFAQLTKMWQGALDGGVDSAKMQAAFDREFTRRGFWGSTQRAYDLVREEAKQQAKEDAAAAAAKKKAQDALGKKPPEGGAAGASAGKTEPGKGHASAINGGAAGAAGGAGVNAVVQEQAAPLPNFLTMSKVSDADMQKLMASVENRQGLLESAPKMGAQESRFTQIMGQLKRAGGSFKDSLIDTVKWGVVSNIGEKLVGGIVEKGLGEKVPIVGPVIMLALQPPWKGDYWTGKDGVLTGMKSGGEHFAHMGKDFEAFKDVHSFKDALGVYCALVADLFAGIHDVLNAINTVLGTLSALCLILGAVLIGVGIALCWLGIGEALMAAGGWLVEAGETLGDISMALIPICLALSAISLVFRTAAAAMVPAELYATELAEEGDAADQFGKAAGQKIGLDASHTIEEATAKKTETKTTEGTASTETSKAQGQAQGAEVAQTVGAETTALQETAAHAEAHGKQGGGTAKPEATPGKPEATPGKAETATGNEKPPAEHTETADKHAEPGQDPAEAAKKGAKKGENGEPQAEEAPGEKKGENGEKDEKGEKKDEKGEKKNKVSEKVIEIAGDLFRRIGESIRSTNDLGRNLERLGGTLKEFAELRHGRATADRGLETVAEQSREVLDEMGKKADKAQADIDNLTKKLKAEEGTLSEEETAKLNKQLREAIDSWAKARTSAERLQKRLAKISERQKSLREHGNEGKPGDKAAEDPSADPKQQQQKPAEDDTAAKDEGGEQGEKKSRAEQRREAEDEARTKRKALDKANEEAPKLEAEQAEAEKTLEAAKARKAEAEEQAKAALDKLAKDPQAARKRAAVKTVEAHERAVEKAKGLREQAERLDAAETTRAGAMQVLEKTVGTAVEVGGEPCKIVGFSADGVLVEPAAGGARRAVPADELKGDLPSDFKDQVQRVQQANQTLAKELQGSPGQDPAQAAQKLRDQASAIDAEEHQKREGSNKKRQTWEKDQKLAAKWKADHARAEAPAKAADAAYEQAEKDYDKKKEAVAENKHERQELEHEVHEQEEKAAELRRDATRDRRGEKAKEMLSEYLGKDVAPEAWEWLKKVLGLEDKLRETQEVVASKQGEKEAPGAAAADEHADQAKQAAAKPPGDEAPAAPGATVSPAAAKPDADGSDKKKEGGEGEGEGEDPKKLHDEALAIGTAKMLYDQALALPPPADIGQLGEHRKKASDAAAVARDKHAKAYQCYQGELAVAKLAQQTGQLAEHGKPLHKRAQQMAAPIDKSKNDEASRATTLAGAQSGDVKGSDSRMGGLVVGLISKLADHSDRLSQKPDAGGASGSDMAGSQDKAATESANRSQQSKSMSQSQHQFLDAAQQTRASQEASVAKNIQGLEAKQHQEQGHLEQIRQNKAQALAEEAQARQQAETEAGAFNAGYARATAWATEYEKRRADLAKAGRG